MTQLMRRRTYQFGTLTTEPRKDHNVYVYRYSEVVDGKKRRPKVIIGRTDEMNEDEALIATEHLRMQANAGVPSRGSVTVNGLANRYLNEILMPCINVPIGGVQDEDARMSFDNAKGYRTQLNNRVIPVWGHRDVREFEKPEVQTEVEDWLRSLKRSRTNRKGLSGSSVRHVYTAMQQAFKFGVKWGYLSFNPFSEKRIELPRGCSQRGKHALEITPQEFFKLLRFLPLRERVAVALAGWLGPRCSEAFGLKWKDFDLNHGVVTFWRGFVHGRITPLKTEASRASIPVPEPILQLLREWQAVTPFKRPEDWLFASSHHNGKLPLWPCNMLKKYIQPIAVAAGLPRVTWHSFRHSVSAWLQEAGVPLVRIKAALRHSNIQTTQKYGKPRLSNLRKLQSRLEAYFQEELRNDTVQTGKLKEASLQHKGT